MLVWVRELYLTYLQFAAESAYDMVSPGPSVRVRRRMTRRPPRRFAQPVDLREGVSNAVNIITGVSKSTFHRVLFMVVFDINCRAVELALLLKELSAIKQINTVKILMQWQEITLQQHAFFFYIFVCLNLQKYQQKALKKTQLDYPIGQDCYSSFFTFCCFRFSFIHLTCQMLKH